MARNQFSESLKWRGVKDLTASMHAQCNNKVIQSQSGETGGKREVMEMIGDKRGRLRVGTWNVRSLNGIGRLEEVKREMKRNGLSILGISEVRWKGQKEFVSDGVRVISSGGEECERGVAFILDQEVARRLIEIKQCSDRLIMIKVSATPIDMVIIQVYMPTSDHADEEIEEMYEQIEKLINGVKGNTNLIVMGDFNASVGEGNDEKVTDKFSLRKM